ncbi:MAG TPA: hypothetical protein VIA81_10365 [Acidimicrobiia bacterium]|jgi:hypothetical protein
MGPSLEAAEERLLKVLTTEHGALQSARVAANSEANTRVLIFLSTLSNSMVALAFVGQASDFGTAFYTFALIILPALLVIGFATLMRTLQNLMEDAYFGVAINRIRSHYKTLHPDAESLLLIPTTIGLNAVRAEASIEKRVPRLQPLYMISGMVAFVEALVAGAFVAVLINRLFEGAGAWGVAMGTITAIGVVTALFLHTRTYVWGALATLGVDPPWKKAGRVS